ncbi:formylglycine-generating enzyme family protein [Paracoccus sp. DMF]|uniref:formylglycine-generating enzyme family protein n=1 Tax=Paracoccus sp. DMF TaxID=400837 RepID=UPI0021E483EE|nr:formylglycine-generating enzyme family protein [Paracoccus sp. DMF]MCV2446173.1 formylglycine-generating enzyme family protein [Paracoccus sp. DMF]
MPSPPPAPDPTTPQVLTRALDWNAVARRLRAAGWSPLDPPVDPGPVAWRSGGATLWLLRDLATRNLVLRRSQGGFVPDGLALMPPDEIIGLARSADALDRLAALQAAEGADAHIAAVCALALVADPEPAIAEQALALLDRLGAGSLPTHSAAALFALPGWRREKLQIMRWWMRDRPAGPARVEGALARALTDPDWEIAVTAMLAAGSLRLAPLAGAVARIRLPETKSEGVTHDEARMILALRDAVLVRLGGPPGKALPPGVEAVLDGDPDHLPPGLRDTAAALSQPLPVGTPPPPAPGVILGPAGPALADGALLTWVPPGTYRLGTALAPRGTVPNPPHRVTLERGFYIDSLPRPAVPLAAAQAEARRLGGRLPTPDQWEMAARGADGRRYPWGMNAAKPTDLSPLGLSGLIHGPGEWLDPGPGKPPLIAGGAASPVPANRLPSPASESRSHRLIFVL